MAAKAIVPKLRFKDDEGREFPEWVEAELQSICEINPKTGQLPETFVYVDLESVEKGILLKQTVIAKYDAPSRAQRVLKSKDVLFQMVRPYQGNNLFFNETGSFVASTGYAQIRTSEDPRFLYHYLHLESFTAEVMNRCTGTSYPAINSGDLGSIEISLPSEPEQTKIANFLTAVDTKISQLTKKHELLTLYKKGVMQKIFSQELRFIDDQGREFAEWEEKRLGEIAAFFSGGTPLTTNRKFYDGNIPFIKSGEINSSNTAQFITEGALIKSSAKLVKSGDILYALYGATSGEVAIAKISGAINQAVLCIRPKLTNYFLYSYLRFSKDSILKKYIQGGQGNLSADIIKSLNICCPSTEEQIKISTFLKAIDDKITNAKSQLEAAKQYKQGLLQQMFV